MVLVAQNESKLSNLKLPLFAEWVLTYNWSRRLIKLEFEVLQFESSHSLDDQMLLNWSKTFLDILEINVMNNVENQLSLIINVSDEQSRFIFDFTGILKNKREVEEWLEDQKMNGQNIEIEQLDEEVLVIHVIVD
ncbi:Spo0B C-terminal domain-containing protein [Rossellomorea aquimaris]|uniref:Spo0B C-terminal domain-containing protein n=1 Tax=Rossellomorea aquimaris TaxID=189382 RepID=UPI0009ECD627|nr:Spo0B C-terminal domain-containing protein [Rossellomorea aquimaris]